MKELVKKMLSTAYLDFTPNAIELMLSRYEIAYGAYILNTTREQAMIDKLSDSNSIVAWLCEYLVNERNLRHIEGGINGSSHGSENAKHFFERKKFLIEQLRNRKDL